MACQMAAEVLQSVVSSICTRTITINAPGVSRFLEDKECKSILKEMETKFQVYISPKHVPWEYLPHQVTLTSKSFSYRLVFVCVFEVCDKQLLRRPVTPVVTYLDEDLYSVA